MFQRTGRHAPRMRDEGEKPFWISFADLMSAMMILFLVVMVASLSALTRQIAETGAEEKERAGAISTLCNALGDQAKALDATIIVDCGDNRISFGEAGRFATNQYALNDQGRQALQNVVPLILDAADSVEGQRWFKQVVVEGFTDNDGQYLYNLHLSLRRSEWVMCALLDSRSALQQSLSPARQQAIRTLFLAGGVSFNNAKESKEASRRVELRLQFYGLREPHEPGALGAADSEIQSARPSEDRCQLAMTS